MSTCSCSQERTLGSLLQKVMDGLLVNTLSPSWLLSDCSSHSTVTFSRNVVSCWSVLACMLDNNNNGNAADNDNDNDDDNHNDNDNDNDSNDNNNVHISQFASLVCMGLSVVYDITALDVHLICGLAADQLSCVA